MFFEAGVMISLRRFLWQELPLKHPKRAQDVRRTSALRGPERSGDFPNKQGFRVTKALLAEDLRLMRSRHFLFTLKACCAIMSIEFFDGLETT